MKWSERLRSVIATAKPSNFRAMSMRNRYPCTVVGEKNISQNHDTIILYRVSPKKEVFEIKLKDLLDNPVLIEKFHPSQAVKLGFMACGDIIFKLPSDKERFDKFQEISSKITFNQGS